jgi:asparagine synthase (glutamine-hydrolysing)
MCGILGFSNKCFSKDNAAFFLQKLGALQYHRGPDQWGSFIDENVSLGHNRLSIIDIDLGKQPMVSHDNRYYVVFNGEIYNYKVLRNELLKLGIPFKTNSDTEVLINGFSVYKYDFIKRLSGMFSFCIYDKSEKKIILCRDSIGIKPLYYSIVNSQMVFSSELKPIILYRKLKSNDLVINVHAVKRYFHFRSGTFGDTMLNDVKSLTPGFYLTFDLDNGIIEQNQFYSPILNRPFQVDKFDELDTILSASVNAHMISDVPLGVFLSGGVDSSMITHYASKTRSVSNFTIATDSEYDESKFAIFASNSTSSSIYLKRITGADFFKEYDYWAFVNDDPVSDPSALALMILSKFAKESGYKVMLAGEGADELFGGYYSYFKYILQRRLSCYPLLGNVLKKVLSRKYPKINDYNDISGYLGTAHLTSFFEKRRMFANNIDFDPSEFEINYSSIDSNDDLRLACLADQKYRLPADILSRTDRATMAYSIEARVPFLSPEMINFANSLQQDDCIDLIPLQGKVILKKLALRYFPKEFVFRKKVGFDLPVADWLSNDFREIIYSHFLKRKLDFLDYKYIQKVYETKMNPGLIWAWLQLENWHDKVFSLNVETKHPLLHNQKDYDNYFQNESSISALDEFNN